MSRQVSADSKDEIIFADETSGEEYCQELPGWKLLIVDDEEVIHSATRIALDNYHFENRPLTLLNAYSGKEAKEIFKSHRDIAVVLLDVVMESDDSGLEVARYIRGTLRNNLIRIILRTGQPGAAPEKKVIMDYDINDYKEKTELTEKKLFTTITTAIRAYRDLKSIEKNRRGLELIVGSTGHLFADQRLQNFTEGVLTQLQAILNIDEGSFFSQASGFAVSHEKDQLNVLAATGKFSNFINNRVEDVVPAEMLRDIDEAIKRKESIFTGNAYVGYFCTENGSVNVLYLHGCQGLETIEKDLIRTFSSNISIAYDKIFLNREILDTQREVIEILGSIVESRSNETANHVRRVAEFTYLLALRSGLSEREASLLKYASPMHDIGKIGIPDAILNKPSKLTDDEFALIKRHATIGYTILKNSKRDIMQAAAIVAHQHHERWNGQGYPQGLAGENIDVYGRITALVDVFDALINKRAYKTGFPISEVVKIITQESGRHFEPRLTDIFLHNIDAFVYLNNLYAD